MASREPVELTNSYAGTIAVAVFNYDAFGDALNFNHGSAATAYLFGGDAQFDAPSGLCIHGNGIRDRMGFFFIERDTYQGNTQDPLSLHKYLYVAADPIFFHDPTGHSGPSSPLKNP